MRTNPAVDINTDWQLNGIVKPRNVNALTRSIKYDYVLTAQMLEGKTGNVDVFDLLNIGLSQGTLVPGDTHILINTPVPDDVVLQFPGNQGGPTGYFNIHIYALGAFKADCTGTSPQIYFFFHTHGTSGAVTLLGLGAHMYVGSFALERPLALSSPYSTFTYEMALGELPTLQDVDASIEKAAWLSNGMGTGGGGSSNVLKLCAYGAPYNVFDVNPSYTDPEDIDGHALDLEGYDSVEWFTNLGCADHIEAEYGIQLDAPVSNSGAIVLDGKATAHVNPENCKCTGASFTIKRFVSQPIEDGAYIEFVVGGGFAATGVTGSFSAHSYGTIRYTGVTISGVDMATTIDGGIENGGATMFGEFSGQITGGSVGNGDTLNFGFVPNFSGKISGSIVNAKPSTGASLSGTGTIKIFDDANQPVITLTVANGVITSGEINEANVTQNGAVSGGTVSSNLPRITKFIPARCLTIDPDTMVEGKVYPIHIKCWNRGADMAYSLDMNATFYPVCLYNSTRPTPETYQGFSKFGYDADGYYVIASGNYKYAIKALDGSPLSWDEPFEEDVATTPASGFEPFKASGAHNDGHSNNVIFTASHPNTPGASFLLFGIRILNAGIYVLNNESTGQIRPKMVTVAPPSGATWEKWKSPAPYAGTAYLMKKNGKVYGLGY